LKIGQKSYEKELLELYRQLSEETQDFILELTRTLLKRHREKGKTQDPPQP
jgi:hypothetical protein